MFLLAHNVLFTCTFAAHDTCVSAVLVGQVAGHALLVVVSQPFFLPLYSELTNFFCQTCWKKCSSGLLCDGLLQGAWNLNLARMCAACSTRKIGMVLGNAFRHSSWLEAVRWEHVRHKQNLTEVRLSLRVRCATEWIRLREECQGGVVWRCEGGKFLDGIRTRETRQHLTAWVMLLGCLEHVADDGSGGRECGRGCFCWDVGRHI